MSVDFEMLTKDYYMRTQNIELARDQAWKDVISVWAPTEINGEREMMKYAPEAWHGAWAPNQFKSDMAKIGLNVGALISDDVTARTGGLSYGVVRPDGSPVIVEVDGVLGPARWVPDVKSTPEFAEAEASRAERFTEAQKIRDRRGEEKKATVIPFGGVF